MLKIKRNDKCPCGSGKKYKKCCYLNSDKNAEIIRATSIAKTYEEAFTILSKPTEIYQIKIDLIRMGLDEIEEEISRIIEIEDKQTLYDLHINIQQLFDWDNDHMFSFYLGEELFDRDNEYSANPLGENIVSSYGKQSRSATEYELRDLDLPMGFSFWYLFDYEDELVHKVTVEKIRELEPEESGFPKLIDRKGNTPPQYGVFEE
ncbi:MAG: SEC-C metal-binding domain-containing protein [Desulfobacterales bacterium]